MLLVEISGDRMALLEFRYGSEIRKKKETRYIEAILSIAPKSLIENSNTPKKDVFLHGRKIHGMSYCIPGENFARHLGRPEAIKKVFAQTISQMKDGSLDFGVFLNTSDENIIINEYNRIAHKVPERKLSKYERQSLLIEKLRKIIIELNKNY